MGFWTRVHHALNVLYQLCGAIAALMLMALTGLVLLSIATRLAGTYIAGLTEFAGYAMAAGSFFAMSHAFRHGAHIRVLLVVNRLDGRARRANDLWCLGVFAAVVSYLAYYLCDLAYDAWRFGEISEGSDAIHLWIAQLPTAIGAVVFAISALHTFIETLVRPDTLKEIDSGGGMGTE